MFQSYMVIIRLAHKKHNKYAVMFKRLRSQCFRYALYKTYRYKIG